MFETDDEDVWPLYVSVWKFSGMLSYCSNNNENEALDRNHNGDDARDSSSIYKTDHIYSN